MAKPDCSALQLVNRFEKAAQALAWKGAQMPELHASIEEEYRQAKEGLLAALRTKKT